MKFKVAPLPASFTIFSLVGLIISVRIFENYPDWAFAFMLVFSLMFVASMISLAHAPVGSYDLKKEGILKKKEKK